MTYKLPKNVLTSLGGFSSLPVMDPSLTNYIPCYVKLRYLSIYKGYLIIIINYCIIYEGELIKTFKFYRN